MWLESNDDYERFRSKVEYSARHFVFSSWFPQERIYIPFAGNQENNKAQQDLAGVLKDFHGGFNSLPQSPNGYEIVDYKKGLAKPIGAIKQNTYKISKIIDALYIEEERKANAELQSNKISPLKHQQELASWEKYINGIRLDFENDPNRVKQNEFFVVISGNVHDLASMSTGRGWTSCMNLKDGVQKKDVYCEVANGGFVAYLIRANDKDIEKPIARIHIRRFDNKKGSHIAVPEESIYGTEVPGFMEVVKKWLMEKQGNVNPGNYTRRGGSYSDTFGDRKYFISPDPNDKDKIRKWILKWFKLSFEDKGKHSMYFLHALAAMLKSTGEWDQKFVNKVADFVFSDKLIPTKGWNQSTSQFKGNFALRFPEVMNKSRLIDAIGSASDGQDKLLQAFPQFVDEEVVKGVKKKHKLVNTQFSDFAKKQIEAEALEGLDINNPEFKRSAVNQGTYHAYNVVDEYLGKLEIFNPIPEPIIRKIVKLYNDLEGSDLIFGEERVRGDIARQIMHTFFMTHSDTPTVQNFYESLLPDWVKIGGIRVFGYPLAQLKEKKFIPFLKKKMENPNDKTHHSADVVKENYLWTIDSIETGSFSTKYHFTH